MGLLKANNTTKRLLFQFQETQEIPRENLENVQFQEMVIISG